MNKFFQFPNEIQSNEEESIPQVRKKFSMLIMISSFICIVLYWVFGHEISFLLMYALLFVYEIYLFVHSVHLIFFFRKILIPQPSIPNIFYHYYEIFGRSFECWQKYYDEALTMSWNEEIFERCIRGAMVMFTVILFEILIIYSMFNLQRQTYYIVHTVIIPLCYLSILGMINCRITSEHLNLWIYYPLCRKSDRPFQFEDDEDPDKIDHKELSFSYPSSVQRINTTFTQVDVDTTRQTYDGVQVVGATCMFESSNSKSEATSRSTTADMNFRSRRSRSTTAEMTIRSRILDLIVQKNPNVQLTQSMENQRRHPSISNRQHDPELTERIRQALHERIEADKDMFDNHDHDTDSTKGTIHTIGHYEANNTVAKSRWSNLIKSSVSTGTPSLTSTIRGDTPFGVYLSQVHSFSRGGTSETSRISYQSYGDSMSVKSRELNQNADNDDECDDAFIEHQRIPIKISISSRLNFDGKRTTKI